MEEEGDRGASAAEGREGRIERLTGGLAVGTHAVHQVLLLLLLLLLLMEVLRLLLMVGGYHSVELVGGLLLALMLLLLLQLLHIEIGVHICWSCCSAAVISWCCGHEETEALCWRVMVGRRLENSHTGSRSS